MFCKALKIYLLSTVSYLAHRIQLPIPNLQIQTNIHDLFFGPITKRLQAVLFVCLCDCFVCQKYSNWLKDSGKFRIRNWLLDPMNKMFILEFLLQNVSTGIFADGALQELQILHTTYPNLKCTENIT